MVSRLFGLYGLSDGRVNEKLNKLLEKDEKEDKRLVKHFDKDYRQLKELLEARERELNGYLTEEDLASVRDGLATAQKWAITAQNEGSDTTHYQAACRDELVVGNKRFKVTLQLEEVASSTQPFDSQANESQVQNIPESQIQD